MVTATRQRASSLSLTAFAAAALWPYVIRAGGAHRVATQAAIGGLVALSFTPVLGWLRALPLYQPAAVAVAAYVTARMFAFGQALPLALLAGAAAGVLVALVAYIPAARAPARALPLASLAVTLAAWGLLSSSGGRDPFQRPVFLGIDLASERALYLLALVLLAAAAAAVGNVHAAGAGRRLIALGADPSLAALSGLGSKRAWFEAVAVSGGLAGLAGAMLAISAMGMPAAVSFRPALALAWLAGPVLGGAAWAGATLAGAVAVSLLAAALAPLGVAYAAVAAVVLVAARLWLPEGLAGLLDQGWRR